MQEPYPDHLQSTVTFNPSSSDTRKSSFSAVTSSFSISRKQLQSLHSKIKQQTAFNRRRFDKLLTLNPYFTLKLYSPNNALPFDEHPSSTMKSLMRQIDLLLDQGNLLEKQIKKAELRRMQMDHSQPSLRDQLKHHFAFLRRVWVDAGREESRGTLDRIEELNKRVVIIKNSIMAVADHQRAKMPSNNQHYESVDLRAREAVRQSEEYRQLKERWEGLGMELQAREAQLASVVIKYEQKMMEKGRESERLMREVEELRRNNKELKEKVISCQKKQAKLTQRISELEAEVRRGKNHLKENTESNANLKLFKQDYINQIKFRKIDMDPHLHLRRPIQPISQSQKILQSHVQPFHNSIQDTSTPKQPLSLHTISESATQPESQKEESTQEEPSSIRQGRSVEAKRGRFSRMRSPANGKLMKLREEGQRLSSQTLSPRLKQLHQQTVPNLAIKTCQFQ